MQKNEGAKKEKMKAEFDDIQTKLEDPLLFPEEKASLLAQKSEIIRTFASETGYGNVVVMEQAEQVVKTIGASNAKSFFATLAKGRRVTGFQIGDIAAVWTPMIEALDGPGPRSAEVAFVHESVHLDNRNEGAENVQALTAGHTAEELVDRLAELSSEQTAKRYSQQYNNDKEKIADEILAKGVARMQTDPERALTSDESINQIISKANELRTEIADNARTGGRSNILRGDRRGNDAENKGTTGSGNDTERRNQPGIRREERQGREVNGQETQTGNAEKEVAKPEGEPSGTVANKESAEAQEGTQGKADVDDSVRSNIRKQLKGLPELTKEEEKKYRVTDVERTEMQERVRSWLSDDNLAKAKDMPREEIIANFGNDMLPVAYVPAELMPILGSKVKSNRIMSTEWYFVDHSVTNHPTVKAQDYSNMQKVLDNPLHIRVTKNSETGADSFVFTQRMPTQKGNRWNAVTIQIEVMPDGSLVWYKNYYNQRQEPNKRNTDLLDSYRKEPGEAGDLPSFEEDSSIVRTVETVHGRSLSARPDSSDKNNTSSSNDQENLQKNEGKKKEIDDVGEKIAGARKGARKEIAKSIENATVASLVELPFGKAYKKPNLKKAVETGALREKDATFYDVWVSSSINPTKPKVKKNDAWHKKRNPSYVTDVEKWAESTFKQLQFLKLFVEADEETRDQMIEASLGIEYPDVENEKAMLAKRKEWNSGKDDLVWGEKWTPNPLAVTFKVMEKLGYQPGDKLEIPYGRVSANSSFTGYTLENAKGERLYSINALETVNDAIEAIVYLAKLKRGDSDTQHPMSSYVVRPTRSIFTPNGKYQVSWISSGYNIKSKVFDSEDEARMFQLSKPGSIIKPVEERTGNTDYKIFFRNPLTQDAELVHGEKFETKDEADAYLDENYEGINDRTNEILAKGKEKKAKGADDLLGVSLVKGDAGWKYAVVLKPEYSNNFGMPAEIKGGFESREEAKKFAEGIKDQVYKLYTEAQSEKKNFVYFDTGENSRLGEDYRGGRDVTADDFMNQFGFRGVQFGNWTNQADRQMAVNQAYDSFMDLAKLLGMTPRALSLNGELGIAFGARGGGSALAHYEPSEVVINLTKTKGAGSLAHEWWHALDNYLSRKEGVAGGMVTDSKSIAMRAELRNAFNHLIDQISKSEYYQRSKKRGDYWGRMHEVTARLLAEWVDQSLKAKGELNTFLSRGANVDKWQQGTYDRHTRIEKAVGREPMSEDEWNTKPESLEGWPFPTKQEVEEFGSAMRNIFDVIQEKEENGKTMLFNMVEEEFGDIETANKGRMKDIEDEMAEIDDRMLELEDSKKTDSAEYAELEQLYSDLNDEYKGLAMVNRLSKEMELSGKNRENVKTGTYKSSDGKQTSWVQLNLFGNEGQQLTMNLEPGKTEGKASGTEARAESAEAQEGTQAGQKTPEQFRLRKLEAGEKAYVERRYQENKMFSFSGGEKVETADDVAYIFRSLEDSAVENTFMVLLKDGTPTIIHTGIGNMTTSMLDASAAQMAIDNIKPDKVIMVHNHPSGNLSVSRPDRELHKTLKEMYGGMLGDSIIIDQKSGKYAVFNAYDHEVGQQTAGAEKEVDYKTYSFNKNVFAPDYEFDADKMNDPEKVAAFISSHRLGDRGKLGVLLMDNKFSLNGNVFLPYNELTEKNLENVARKIVSYGSAMSGRLSILFGSGSIPESLAERLKMAVGKYSGNTVSMVDAVMTSGLKQEVAEVGEVEPFGEISETDKKDFKAYDAENKTEIGKFLDYVKNGYGSVNLKDYYIAKRKHHGFASERDAAKHGVLPFVGNLYVERDIINPKRHRLYIKDNGDKNVLDDTHYITPKEWAEICKYLIDEKSKTLAIAETAKENRYIIYPPITHHSGLPLVLVAEQIHNTKKNRKGYVITAYGEKESNTERRNFLYGSYNKIKNRSHPVRIAPAIPDPTAAATPISDGKSNKNIPTDQENLQKNLTAEQIERNKEYADAVKNGDKETYERLLQEEADKKLNTVLLPDDKDEKGFKYHRGEAPTKTFKRYAVLNVSPEGFKAAYAGNKNGTPVGVWLDAQNLQSYMSDKVQFDDGTFASYIEGDTGAPVSEKFSDEKRKEYGLKGSSRLLLERGGKHSSDVPNFSQMNLKQDENGNKVTSAKKDGALPHNKLIFEIEYGISDDGDLTDYVKANGRKMNGQNQGLAKIGSNQYYDFKTNPNAVGKWGIGGTFRITRLVPYEEVVSKTEDYKKEAIAEAERLYKAGEISKADYNKQIRNAEAIQVQKWVGGYHPEDSGLTVESVDQMYQEGVKKKLFEPTYDDDGKLIPLSERFNMDKDDMRFSFDEEDTSEATQGSSAEQMRESIRKEGKKAIWSDEADEKQAMRQVAWKAPGSLKREALAEADKDGLSITDPERLEKGMEKVMNRIYTDGPQTADEYNTLRAMRLQAIEAMKRRGVLDPGSLTSEMMRQAWIGGDAGTEPEGMLLNMDEEDNWKPNYKKKPRRRPDKRDKDGNLVKKGESDLQYIRRVQEWEHNERKKHEAELSGEKIPNMEDYTERAQKQFNAETEEWYERHGLKKEVAEVGEVEPIKTNKKSSATVAPLSKENVNASAVAKDSDANVIQKLETTKKSYNKVKRTRGFITDVSQDLGLEHRNFFVVSTLSMFAGYQ